MFFAPDRAHVFEPSSVGTDSLVEDLCTHFFFVEIVNTVFEFSRVVGIDVRKVFQNLRFDLSLSRLALLSVERVDRPFDFLRGVFPNGCVQLFGDMIQLDGKLLFSDCGNDSALFPLSAIGVDDVFAVYQTDDDGTRRPCPGDIGNCERHGRADHCERFGCDVGFHGERRSDNDDVVEQSLGKQGTQRTVDKTSRQNRLVACSALSALKSARYLSDGEHFLFVIHLQREEVDAVPCRRRHTHRHHDGGVAAAHDAHSVRLLCVFARLDRNVSSADRQLKLFVFHIILLLILFCSCASLSPDRGAKPL